jgi:hypothetical protein
MLFDTRRRFRSLLGFGTAWTVVWFLLSAHSPAGASQRDSDPPGVLLLTGSASAERPVLTPVVSGMACAEPNLVIITHGWYEREAWPSDMALAIAAKVDLHSWRCGWFDWRAGAHHLLPSEATKIALKTAGPQLGRDILSLSRQWRHVHLIGHSAGCWVVNVAAEMLAKETAADIHITFLDAYVPNGWDETVLGKLTVQPPRRCWIEHYFTRDFLLGLTENVLTEAYNVDITKANPGFNGHRFPIFWYLATVTDRYDMPAQLAGKTLWSRADGVECGFARSLESGRSHWSRSLALRPEVETVQIKPSH